MKEEVYLLMSKISDFRKKLKSNPETAKLLMPGTKYEALLDLDGDGKMDFALMDTTGDGNRYLCGRHDGQRQPEHLFL